MDIKLTKGESFNIKNSGGTNIISVVETGDLVGLGTVSSIKMNGETINSESGEINLGIVLCGVTVNQRAAAVSNGVASIDVAELPAVTSGDDNKVLQVVNGIWQVVTPLVVWSGSDTPSSGVGNNGDLYIQTAEMMREPDVLYETDGTSGLIGINESALTNSAWQVENLNMAPYRTVRFYFKEADVAALTGNSFTPAVVVEVPLDTAALAQNAATQMFVGGANTCHPNDQNNQYIILVAVDSTKTKAKVVMQKTLYGTAQTGRNDSGRYCYKIEGWY